MTITKNIELISLILSNSTKKTQNILKVVNPFYRTEKLEYFVLADRKLVYLVNSKAACSSIKKSLLGAANNDFNDNNYGEIHKESKKLGFVVNNINNNQKVFYGFTFVRNPFERLVSLYINKFEDIEKIEKIGFEYAKYLGGIFDENISFSTFIDVVSTIPDRLSERHFISQHYLISNSALDMDFIGKMESINDDYQLVAQKYGLPSLPHKNKSASYEYKSYYTKELLEKVYHRYEKDILNFGYKDLYLQLLEELN